jgi:hypothetical protein
MPTLVNLMNLTALSPMSPAVLAFAGEAAAVMLDKFHPTAAGGLALDAEPGERGDGLCVAWTAPDESVMASHADERVATEYGACGIAIAAVSVLDGFTVRRRLHQSTGADYIMTRAGEPENDFYRLEVSGIARGGSLRARMREKHIEARSGNLDRPYMAMVVHFERAKIARENGS